MLLAGSADASQIVELGVDAVADQAAVAGDGRGLVEKRAIQLVAKIREIVELGHQAVDERRLQIAQEHPHPRHRRNRLPQRHQIARSGDPERGARHQPFDVMNGLERLAQLGPFRRSKRQLFDGVEPILNPFERDERPEQPGAEHPSAHRGHRPVDLDQERAGRAAVDGFEDLEIAQRSGIDDQAVGAGAKRDLAHVREISLLRVAKIVDERAGGAHRGRALFEAKPGEALGAELFEQGLPRRLLIKRPRRAA